jgi:primosomal protein N' (replication factor Y) (superfamily II helicase)
VKEEYNIDPIIIDSPNVNSPNKIKNINKLLQTKNQEKKGDIIIGTSLLTTPIKHNPADLVILLNADIGLNIPDYTAAEKNFYFLYEALHNYKTAHCIVQSFNPEQYSIRTACKMDPASFHEQDAVYRKKYHYPAYGELCVLLYKHEIEERLYANVDKLYKELLYYAEKYELKNTEIYTTPPLIYKKFGKYRYNIVLK